MKTIRLSLLFVFGALLIAFAVFAFDLGLDPSPGWGKSRAIAFALGIFLLAVFADLRFGLAWTETALAALPHPAFLKTSLDERVRIPLVYGSAALAFLIAATVHLWFASAGTWTTLPPASNYYDMLANAFSHGQVSLELEVPPQLLALPDPYIYEDRQGIEYLWDAILHQGKYYLYWGPMPAVLLTAVKLVRPLEVGDHIVVLASALGLTLFQTLLLTRIWMRSFRQLPAWTLFPVVLLAGLVAPVDWMIHRANIYEASILSAQVFLMGGLYFAYRAFEQPDISPRWLAWTSIFWTCAVASRSIIALTVIFLALLTAHGILRRHGLSWTPRFNALVLALGLPLLTGAIGLGAYNAVRFGSVFDFGLDYMLTSHNNREFKGDFFSREYIAANTYNYFLHGVQRIRPFPYFRATIGEETEVFGTAIPEPYYAEEVTGLVYILPFAIFAFVPALQMVLKKLRRRDDADSEQGLNWLIAALSGAILIVFGHIMIYCYGTMRYLADATPMMVVLASLGFWTGYRAVKSDAFVCFAYTSFGFLLAAVSIAFPWLTALLSAHRINQFSPQVLPALNQFFKSILSG